jgi:hypothetical protein
MSIEKGIRYGLRIASVGGLVGVALSLNGLAHEDASRDQHNKAATGIEKQIEGALPPAGKDILAQRNRVNSIIAPGATDTPIGQALKEEGIELDKKLIEIELKNGQWVEVGKAQRERAAAAQADFRGNVLAYGADGAFIVSCLTFTSSFSRRLE